MKPSTMAANPEELQAMFERYLKEGRDILHLAFSSELSSSYNNAAIVARELNEQYTENKVIVIDTLSASLGQGLIVYKAVQLRDEGKTIDETAAWVEENKLHFCHQFTVDDLNHLYRGGRVSKLTAVAGTLIHVKPILHVSDEGKLIPIGKSGDGRNLWRPLWIIWSGRSAAIVIKMTLCLSATAMPLRMRNMWPGLSERDLALKTF